jgi:hypothetical protein
LENTPVSEVDELVLSEASPASSKKAAKKETKTAKKSNKKSK